MARKSLFATDDQPTKRPEGEDGSDVDLESDGDIAVSDPEAQESAAATQRRPEIVAQTQEQRRASLGIEESLLQALRDREDNEIIVKWLQEQAICCGELTLQHLTQAGHISGGDAQSILESYGYYVEDTGADKNILDILAFHVWMKLDTKDERADREIRKMTAQLSSVVPTGVTHCEFDRLGDSSQELFEKFPLAEKICSTLMCPVVQAHERDFVSIASINPVTAATAGVLLEYILEREGVRPFTFVFTMETSAWSALCEKQFDSQV